MAAFDWKGQGGSGKENGGPDGPDRRSRTPLWEQGKGTCEYSLLKSTIRRAVPGEPVWRAQAPLVALVKSK